MGAFDIGISALKTTQRAITTTGHNIANVNTEGYNRQRVEMIQNTPQAFGNGFIGKGVSVSDVRRLADEFLISQVRHNAANSGHMDSLQEMSSLVDRILGEKDSGVSSAISEFFKSVQTLADNPSSIPTRQVVLSNAATVADRFRGLDSRLQEIETETNKKIDQAVKDINSIASTVADLNHNIVQAMGATSGKIPNDLVDQRDQWLDKLAQKVGVQSIPQPDGSVNVMIGSGQGLVIGSESMKLGTVPNPNDASRTEISYVNDAGTMIITNGLTAGDLGGTLRFRDEVLTPAKDNVGRLGAIFAITVNAEHRNGMDLNSALGKNLFSLQGPTQLPAATNTGVLDVAYDEANIKNLSADRYRLSYDGSQYLLHNLTTDEKQVLSGGSPFQVAGLTLTETTAPAAGDAWLLHPARFGATSIKPLVTDPKAVAAASPIRATAVNANVSDAKVAELKVVDPADPGLTTPATVVFDNPPTTYTINGSGPFTYDSAGSIDFNGWQLTLTGAVKAGDQFTVGTNTGGVGDNGNMLRLSGLQKQKTVDGGNSTYEENFAALVGTIGAKTRQANLAAKASGALLKESTDARQALSGVNLDEEATNLLKFQQSYQAAARIITSANEMFQSLLRAAGG